MFYVYDQNNSGGSYVINDQVCEYVIIEAANPDQANQIAEDIGIYFYGVSSGSDCECCGNRWSTASSYSAYTFPSTYGQEHVRDSNTNAFVYYLNGTVERYSPGSSTPKVKISSPRD